LVLGQGLVTKILLLLLGLMQSFVYMVSGILHIAAGMNIRITHSLLY
jgi:hypothetical protein